MNTSLCPGPGGRPDGHRAPVPCLRFSGAATAGCVEHFALVAEQGGAVVALASCHISPGRGAELGIRVEDCWQRRGIGTRLLNMLVQHAGQSGLQPLRARVLTEQAWILRVLRSYGTCETVLSCNAFDVTMHVS